MATITPQTVSGATAETLAAATSGGDTVANASGARLRVVNGGAATITVTLTGQQPCSQGALHNVTFTVAAGATEEEPIPPQCVDSNGNCAVSYSSATSVTVGAFK